MAKNQDEILLTADEMSRQAQAKRKEKLIDLKPSEDFSKDAAGKRSLARSLDVSDSRRELVAKAKRAKEAESFSLERSKDPLSVEFLNPGGTEETNYYDSDQYLIKANELLDLENERTAQRDISEYPAIKAIIKEVEAQGGNLTVADLNNMIDWGIANQAADKIIAASQAGDPIAVQNVMLTLQESNPVIAMGMPSLIEEKILEAIEDPAVIEKISEKAITALGYAMGPFVEVNEFAQEGIRSYVNASASLEPLPGAYDNVYNTEGIRKAGRGLFALVNPNDRDRVSGREANFKEEYIQEIRDSGNYTDLQIEIALEVSKRSAQGIKDPIMGLYAENYLNDAEAGKVFRDIFYSEATGNTQELLRQIDSAALFNTGQVLFDLDPINAEYDINKGNKGRQNAANVLGFVSSIVFDPTLLGAKIYRTTQAAKWALTMLAPQRYTSGKLAGQLIPSDTTIKQLSLGKLNFSNPAYRFFDQFTKDLNRINKLETKAAGAFGDEKAKLLQQAASARNRMTRQYDEMPEDLIEDFRTTMPKNADGEFDVESVTTYIDENNRAFLILSGQVDEEAIALSAAGLTSSRIVKTILDSELYKSVSRGSVTYGEELRRLNTAARLGEKAKRRKLLAPRMSPLAMFRKESVNRVITKAMPDEKAVALISKFVKNAESNEDFIQKFSNNAENIGAEARKNKFRSGEGWFDSLGRAFSSASSPGSIAVTSSKDSQKVYRYARMFLPKRTSEMLAEAFRAGDVGSRRTLLAGLVRTSAASRGITLSEKQVGDLIGNPGIVLKRGAKDTITGSMTGEAYALTVSANPTARVIAARNKEANRIKFKENDDRLDAGEITKKQHRAEEEKIAQRLETDYLEDNLSLNTTSSRSLSEDTAGVQHAIHLSQTTDNIALPSIKDFESLRGQLRTNVGLTAQKATDYWSLGTLFGFRFSIRNAIEETGMYWLTGGTVAQFIAARQASTLLRKNRPQAFVKVNKPDSAGRRAPVYDENGIPEIVYKSSLGMFNKRIEWTKKKISPARMKYLDQEWKKHNGFRSWLADLVMPGALEDDSLMAMQKFAQGNPQAFENLVVRSLGIQKSGLNISTLTPDDEIAFLSLVGSSHGMALMDEVAEAAKYLNSGRFAEFLEQTRGVLNGSNPGVVYGKVAKTTRSGAFKNIKSIDVYGLSFWWRELQTTLDGDGLIGEAALRGIHAFSKRPLSAVDDGVEWQKTVDEIVEIIKNDTQMGYKERFSRIYDDQSAEDFAENYLENLVGHVSKFDGSINTDLVGKFFDKDGNYLGWWEDLGSGKAQPRITKDSLNEYSPNDRPVEIFGREALAEANIPIADTLPAFFSVDNSYGWMGAQNARISREPIFLANYMSHFKESEPARTGLANSLAASRGSSVPSKTEIALSDELYARSAMDSAYSLTLSYVDNPANRSNLAWKSRNIARYYRATEDFYRRAVRVAQTSPEAYWKAALIYSTLEDTGFVYKDENDEKYFLFPGNEYLQSAMQEITSMFKVDLTEFKDIQPFSIGGKVLGLTPSSDPKQFGISLSGPMLAVPVAGITAMVPGFDGLRTALLGQYNQKTGSVLGDMITTALPAGLARAYRTLDPDMVESQITNSTMDALAMMLAEGYLENLTITTSDGVEEVEFQDPETFKLTDQYKAASAITWGSFISKGVYSIFSATSARQYGNTASDFGRLNDIDSAQDAHRDLQSIVFEPEFVEMLTKASEDGEINPFKTAESAWWTMQAMDMIEGDPTSQKSFMPYGLAKNKTNDADGVLPLTQPQVTIELVDFIESPLAKNLTERGFGTVKYFLAPQVGKFDYDSWNIATNIYKIKVSRPENEMILDLFSMAGNHKDSVIVDSIASARASLRVENYEDEEAYEEALSKINSMEEKARKKNRLDNPGFGLSKGSPNPVYAAVNYRKTFGQVREMIKYMEETDQMTTESKLIKEAIKVYLEHEKEKTFFRRQTNYDRSERSKIDAKRDFFLKVYSEKNLAVSNFIDNVLSKVPYDEQDVNKFGVEN